MHATGLAGLILLIWLTALYLEGTHCCRRSAAANLAGAQLLRGSPRFVCVCVSVCVAGLATAPIKASHWFLKDKLLTAEVTSLVASLALSALHFFLCSSHKLHQTCRLSNFSPPIFVF